MSSRFSTFSVPGHAPVASALSPILEAVPACVDVFGPATTANLCRAASRALFVALADGRFDTPAAAALLDAAGIFGDDIDRLAFWLLAQAGVIEETARPSATRSGQTLVQIDGGAPITLAAFYAANADDLDPEQHCEIEADLWMRGRAAFGGGAGPLITLQLVG